jgi:hypothetical protein
LLLSCTNTSGTLTVCHGFPIICNSYFKVNMKL